MRLRRSFASGKRYNSGRRIETKQAWLSFSEYAELTVEIWYELVSSGSASGRTYNKELFERPNVSLQIKVVPLGVGGLGVHRCMGVQRGVPTQPTATNGAPNITASLCAGSASDQKKGVGRRGFVLKTPSLTPIAEETGDISPRTGPPPPPPPRRVFSSPWITDRVRW